MTINVIIGTVANDTKQNGSRQQQNFGSEGWGFESLQARICLGRGFRFAND